MASTIDKSSSLETKQENESDPPHEKANPKRASFSQTFSNADQYDYLLMFLGTIGALAVGASTPVTNVIFGQMINALNKNPDSFSERIDTLCIAYVIVGVVNMLAGYLQVYCWTATGERQTQRFRERYVNALLSQEIGWFDTVGAGQLNTKVAEVIGEIQDGLSRKIGDLLQNGIQVIGSLVVAFYLCWELTLVLLACIPCLAVAATYMIKTVSAATHQAFEQYARAGAVAQEAIGSVRTINAFNLQPTFIAKYRSFILEALRVGVLKGAQVGIGNGAVFGVAFLTYALGFWYGGRLVAHDLEHDCSGNDCITGGTVISVFFSIIIGSMALGQIAPPLTAFVSAQSSIAMIFDLLERTPLIDGLSEAGLVPQKTLQGNIALQEISFAYPSRPDVLVCDRMSLDIPHGETVALVGASGCGKSTIVNLLLRFYDPNQGSITLDGHDLRSLNIKYLRSLIGYVGQEPVLFTGTIGDNIAYGLDPQECASMSESQLNALIEEAAKAANAHDFIVSFPEGYKTDVGGSGSSLSGGQKQRIAIARALIKKPAILLLDEATSALDINSEKVVQASIDRLSQAKTQTTIIVAHRLSTIVNADRICVLRGGHIVEQGRHKDLIQVPNGVYADLVRMQMLSGEEREHPHESDCSDVHLLGTQAVEVVQEKAMVESREPQLLRDDELDTSSCGNKPSSTLPTDPQQNEKEEVVISKDEKRRLTRRVLAMVGQYPGYATLGLLGALFFGAIFPCWGYMLSKTQTSLFLSDPDEIEDRARFYAFLYIMLAGVSFLSSLAMYYGVVAAGEHVAMEMRSALFESFFHHPVAFFDQPQHSVGTLTAQLAGETRFVSKALGEGFARQLQALSTLLVALGLGFSSSWQIAFIVIACFPLTIAAGAVRMKAMRGMQYDHEDDEQKVASENDKQNARKREKGSKQDPNNSIPHSQKSDEDSKQDLAASGANQGSIMAGSHSAVLGVAFTNMRTVSAFSMQHKVATHYAQLTQQIVERRIARSVVAGLGFGGSYTSRYLIYALLFWVGSRFIKDGTINFEELMGAIMTLMLGATGLGQALSDMGDQMKGADSAKWIFEAIDSANDSTIDGLSSNKGLVLMSNSQQPRACDLTSVPPHELHQLEGKIELRNLSFHYPSRPDITVCRGYNLTIAAGEVVAFVGPSGSGKSTIINLLLRFYDPDQGTVLIDEVDIKSLNVRYLRSQIGYVGQEPVLFSGTVQDNLNYGRYEVNFSPLLPLSEVLSQARDQHQEKMQGQGYSCTASCCCWTAKQSSYHVPVPQEQEQREDIEEAQGRSNGEGVPADLIEATKFAHAHSFITDFSDGYQTVVSAMGSGYMISGGQKQRIALARAMLKRPKILLLDEATSALDAQSENLIQQSIDTLTQLPEKGNQSGPIQSRPTVIIVAHRLSTIVNADRIVVIDQGEIKEVGSHEELMAREDGLYRQLFLKQSQGGKQ
eukprot:scaffold6397_cov175-Ochromonas_danica.AAC.26